MDWERFRNSGEWGEIENTIKARQLLILEDLLNPEIPIIKVHGLRAEYSTCNWLLTLPTEIIEEEREDAKREAEKLGSNPL